MKIQIFGGKVCLRCKGKTFLGDVTEGEGDGIKSRLPFKILSTLLGLRGCYHALDIRLVRDNLNL